MLAWKADKHLPQMSDAGKHKQSKKIGATHNFHLAQDLNTSRQMNKETDLELPLL